MDLNPELLTPLLMPPPLNFAEACQHDHLNSKAACGSAPASSRGMWQYLAFDLWPGNELHGLQVIACLQVQPELRRGIEIPRQPQCGVRRDAALFANNIIDAWRGNAQSNRKRVCPPQN